MYKIKKFITLIGCIFLISGCKTHKPITNDLSPYGAMISLDVGDFLIIDDTQPTNLVQTRIYPNSLNSEIQSWANLRLQAKGSAGKAILRILDARVLEENMDSLLKEGKDGADPASLSVNIILGFEFLMPTGGSSSKIEFRLHDTLTLTAKNFDIEKRSSIWQQFVQSIINKVNKDFEKLLYDNFPQIVLLNPSTESNE